MPDHVLVIDTETTTDETQRLLFGAWRYLIRDHRSGSWVCVAEGLIYADDLPERDAVGFATLKAYAATATADVDLTAQGTHEPDWRLRLLSRTEFVNRWWYRLAVPHDTGRKPGRKPSGLVFFNAPFDISRLAADVDDARLDMAGGFSYTIWLNADGTENRYRPRVAVKNIDSKRSLIKYRATAPDTGTDAGGGSGGRAAVADFNGHFIDLRTAVFALTGEGKTLQGACELYGVAGKITPVLGVITTEAIDYCRNDVAATARLFAALVADFEQHPIDLQLTKAYSPASIAKAYLPAMGLVPPLADTRESNGESTGDRSSRKASAGAASVMHPSLHGAAMSAFYGGRAECHIRRTSIPVRLVDFTSMYPTVNALMGTWSLLTAERIEAVESFEARADMQNFLDTLTPETLLRPEQWPRLLALAQIVPDGDLLPIRAAYREGDWSIGLNYLHAATTDEGHWYTLADLAASTLLTGTAPRLRRAVQFAGHGQQSSLREVALRGEVVIDPAGGDFFTAVIEERQRRKAVAKADLVPAFLKVLANSGSYGIYAEMTRQPSPDYLDVFTGEDHPRTPTSKRLYEQPGKFTFPAVGACITGAARLMLALLEHLVAAAGGEWAFCDTDSMAILATPTGGETFDVPGGPVRALSFQQIDEIRETLNQLNPYDRDCVPDILKIEDDGTGLCFVISAKRYAIYQLHDEGRIEILRRSEHGLGQYLNPINPDDVDEDGEPIRDRDKLGAAWVTQAWEWIIRDSLTEHLPGTQRAVLPAWVDRPACSRLTISSPALLRPFASRNQARPWAEQIKPANFMLVATLAPFGIPIGADPDTFRLIAPYAGHTASPLTWSNLHDPTGTPVSIAHSVETAAADAAVISTYRSVLYSYAVHPEYKFDAPDGGPCRPGTRGVLRRCHITPSQWVIVGKEANRLDDVRNGVATPSEVTAVYDDGTAFRLANLVLPALASLSGREIARRTGIDATTVNRIRRSHTVPHAGTYVALERLASEQLAVNR